MISLQINKLVFDVIFTDSDNCNLSVDGQIHCGACQPTAETIYIHEGMSEEITRRTIIHELVHAYVYASGQGKRDNFGEEDLCEFMSAFSQEIICDAEKIINQYKKAQREQEIK